MIHKDIPIFDLTILPTQEFKNPASGFDKIAYVPNPAIDQMGIYLDKNKRSLTLEEQAQLLESLKKSGIKTKEIPSTWLQRTEEDYFKVITDTSILQLTKDPGARTSYNDVPDPQGNGQWLVRYKYLGIKDDKNRDFCRDVLELDRIYTEEEIRNGLSNSDFGQYSIFDFKGNINCRHRWQRLVYFEDYKKDNITRSALIPGFVTQGLRDKDASKLNPAKQYYSSHIKMENAERQQVIAPLLIPDFLILREDEEVGEYYIRFSREVISQIRDKAKSEGKLDSLEIMKDTHRGDLAKAFILEEWITEDENDKAYTHYGFDINKVPLGSWIVLTQIIDKDFWENEIKKNKKHGYSIEVFLNMKLAELEAVSKNKKNKINMENEEILALKAEIERLMAEIAKKEVPTEEVKMADEVKTEEETPAVTEEVKTEVKPEEVPDKVAEEEVKMVEETPAVAVTEEIPAVVEEDLDSKFEAIYKEIADLKVLISTIAPATNQGPILEMSKVNSKNSIKSLNALGDLFKRK